MTAQLKLIALDADDLAVVSAHVQEAHVQAADIIWRQGDKRLVVGMRRLDWEQTMAGEAAPRRLILCQPAGEGQPGEGRPGGEGRPEAVYRDTVYVRPSGR